MSAAVNESAVPVVGRGFRLQWEPAQEAHVLLYPEGMVKLNGSAGEIMKRCDGARTVASARLLGLALSYAKSFGGRIVQRAEEPSLAEGA